MLRREGRTEREQAVVEAAVRIEAAVGAIADLLINLDLGEDVDLQRTLVGVVGLLERANLHLKVAA